MSISHVNIQECCEEVFREEDGFELHPFNTSWYNEKVSPAFQLSYPDDTLGLLIVSGPSMFDRAFKPWLMMKHKQLQDTDGGPVLDPIDQFMRSTVDKAVQHLTFRFPSLSSSISPVFDFELLPNRRPKLLMTTCGHIAGAAFYYNAGNVSPSAAKRFDTSDGKRYLGLSLHPRYGGWFAFRGALFFPTVSAYQLTKRLPMQTLTTDDDIGQALELFNLHWRDNRYRDSVPVKARYSDEQQLYFRTPPSDRGALVKTWLQNVTEY